MQRGTSSAAADNSKNSKALGQQKSSQTNSQEERERSGNKAPKAANTSQAGWNKKSAR